MKFLFVLGDYYPKASANGVCVLKIQEELHKRGIQSDVICEGNIDETIQGKHGIIRCVSKGKRSVNKLLRLIIWPIKDVILSYNYYLAIKRTRANEHYDLIVSALRPIEGAVACAVSGNYVLYELDSITNNGDNLYGLKHMLRYRSANIERFIYKRARHIFHLQCHYNYYETIKSRKYGRYLDKSTYVDIPYFGENKRQSDFTKANGVNIITYLGSLSIVRNTPDYSIKLFSEIAKNYSLECWFYSRGCEDKLQKAKKQFPDLYNIMGYVSQDELYSIKDKTDFFLSIGFNHTGTVTSVPSKIFEYMTTGKPIIHILGGKNDTAIPYLEKYKNAIIVNSDDELNENVDKVKQFMETHREVRVNLNELRKVFIMNTPEYTVEKMLSLIGGK